MKRIKRFIAGIVTMCTLFSMASVSNAASTSFTVGRGASSFSSQTITLDGRKQHYTYSVRLKSFKFEYIPQNASPGYQAKIHFRLYMGYLHSIGDGVIERFSASNCISFPLSNFSASTKSESLWKTIKRSNGQVMFTDGGLNGTYCLKTNSSYTSLGYGCTTDWWIN